MSPLARLPGRWGWWLLPLGLLLSLVVLGNFTPPTWSALRTLRLVDWQATACDSVDWKPASISFARYGSCWRLRARFERPEPAEDGAMLMLGGVHQDAGVVVNRLDVRHAHPRGRQSHLSGTLWIPLAAGLLRPGSNEVEIELRSRKGDLSRVYLLAALVGPRESMERFQLRYAWLHQTGAQSTLVLLGALLLFLLPIAIARPRESLYRWFAAALIGSAVYVSNFATSARPLDLQPWGAAMHLALVFASYALARCSAAMLAEPVPRWAGWLAASAALACVVESLWWPRPGTFTLSVVFRLLTLAQIVALAHWWWQRRTRAQVPDGHWFSAALALLAVLGVLDALRLFLREIWSTPGYLLHWGILYTSLLLFVVLLLRILDGLRQAERNQTQLAATLAERSQALESEFRLRRAAESARMLADERARIMRDMHDGVGGQLVVLIGQVQGGQADAGQIGPQLRRTLDDLRLMIDSLDSACADLSVALGMLRSRMEPLLAGQPVAVRWRTSHLPDLPPAPPATVLHVLRIVQEALTNALRHARASAIEVAADWDGSRLEIVVADDGNWQDGAPGRGLASMRARALAIGAALDLDVASGTRVRLSLPIPSADQP